MIFTHRNSPCGLTDRLKAAVGLCYVAQRHSLPFRMIHRAGFDLRDYLVPNRIPWGAELSDLSPFPWDRERIRYVAPYTDFPAFRPDRQYVCREYVGNNLLEKWNVPDWQQVWRELFRDLFTPSQIVKEAIPDQSLPEHYAAVVVRFVNTLGHTENVSYNSPFTPDVQERIIRAALARVAECEQTSSLPAVVYSDSARFLLEAQAAGYRTSDPGSIGNIMNRGVGEKVILGTFVNLFRMAVAETVYSVLHLPGLPENSLYKTQYPRYATIIGDRPFVRL